jgi:hypothetical protein
MEALFANRRNVIRYDFVAPNIPVRVRGVRRKRRFAIPFGDLAELVRRRHPANTAFRLRLRSSVADVTRVFNFESLTHFDRWIEAIERNNVIQDSENFREVAALIADEDVFNFVIPEILPVEGGCNHHTLKKTYVIRETAFYSFKLFNPIVQDSNCGFSVLEQILETKLNYSALRKQYELKYRQHISTEILASIYRTFNDRRPLVFIDADFNDTINKHYHYIFVENSHYYYVLGADYKTKKDIKTKRGFVYWDIETRMTEEFVMVGNTKSYILKDVILCAYYSPFQSGEYRKLTFRTGQTSSCRQFLDWLSHEAHEGRFYHCIAHNGSRFDMYFLLGALTELEQLHTETQLRGYSIIGAQYKSHLFKDSCCFLTASLDSLCKSFKVKDAKLTEFVYEGKTLSNLNLCFYKPELTFQQFCDLRVKEPDFWNIYEQYCMSDCVGLSEVWSSFRIHYDNLIDIIFKYRPELKANVSLMGSNTIGALSKKILENSCLEKTGAGCGKDGKSGRTSKSGFAKKRWYKHYLKFIDNIEKYEFVEKFKRGGISHSNLPGKHTHPVMSVDIASQYPCSMMEMNIPAGESKWTTEYNSFNHGFYHLKDLVFSDKFKGKFKPVSAVKDSGVLDWNANEIKEVYLDSWMLKYLKQHCGLVSFTIIKGLVGCSYIAGKDLFGDYVDTLYREKKLQDEYKNTKDEKYNPALRECIKLFLNSLSGKLVEDPSRYFTLKYCADAKLKLNGLAVEKELDEEGWNPWIVAGVMVYSYSKRLLWEYVRMLPDGSDSVIHIETDSIYFDRKHSKVFLENISNYTQTNSKLNFYPIAFGSELGNVKEEKNTEQTSYFLGKKFYSIDGCHKIKGIPLSTIDVFGNKINLVDTSLYEKIYNGETVVVDYQTMKKSLFGQTYISSHLASRTINPACKYFLYE